jgi:hypothetical protein
LAKLGALALLAGAESASAEQAPVQIWYRSAAGCPDGAAFIARLAALGRPAQLASAGDRVDFVVTLGGPSPEPQTLGRLERQIQSGSVAIRELRAERCEDVAEALALSLELALKPAQEDAPEVPEVVAPSAPASVPSVSPLMAETAALVERTEADDSRPVWSVGLQGTFATGAAPALMPGLALSVAVAAAQEGPSARLSLRAGYRATDPTQDYPAMHVAVLSARPEGCPWAWAARSLRLEPCIGVDVGVLRTQGGGEQGRTDLGLWLGAAAHVRAVWRVAGRWALEAEVGGFVPFVRYAVVRYAGSAEAFHTESVGLALGLGAAWLPR